MRLHLQKLAPVLLALLGVNAAATAQTVTTLPVQPNSYTYPAAINNSGLAIGNAYDRVTFRSQAVTWFNGAISSLPGFPDSFAGALNDTGVIVGSGFSVADNLYVPVVWENGTTAVLPTLGRGGLARDINSAGDIVGQVETETGGTVPAVWRNRQLTVLPGASGNGGFATAIDDNGVVAGVSYGADGTLLPTQWNCTAVSTLPVSFGADYAGSLGVNKSGGGRTSGYVVEQRALPDGSLLPVIIAVSWDANGYRVLQPLGNSDRSTAYDVNRAGVIAGFSGNLDSGDMPVLWTAEGANKLPYEATRSARAVALNDNGLALGYDSTDGANPVPLLWNMSGAVSTQMANVLSTANAAVTLAATVTRGSTKVSNQRVTFQANGVLIGSANTDVNGVARLPYRISRTPGTSVAITASTDSRSFLRRAIEIRQYAATSAVSASYNATTGTLGLRATLRGRFANNSLARKVIIFNVNGREVARASTDIRGVANASVRLAIPVGRSLVEARFNGDATTASASGRSNIEYRR
jgi:hypothetical protein